MPRTLLIFILAGTLTMLSKGSLQAQTSAFTFADTLRGSLNEFRSCYDVRHYALDLALEPQDSSLSGSVTIAYTGEFASSLLQIDLSPELVISSIRQAGHTLKYMREGAATFVELARPTEASVADTIIVSYHGRPHIAQKPPWDGGLIWKVDSLGRPFWSVSCEGIGASIWWPNKDHLSDEPDSLSFALSVPTPLRVVSNGQFRGAEVGPKRSRYHYAVTYPINNYNVTFYVGHFLTFTDTLHSPNHPKPLKLTFDVLDYNLTRAKRHFKQVKPMLKCYADILGDYPFWQDGYRLVEAPMLGMEHQSGIAYGNNYQRGYNGRMIPPDMNWDYLIIHESGHEYFGNALSASDHAEMWLHESFTTYLEALYVECLYNHDRYEEYLLGQRGFIENAEPLVGPLGVNFTAFTNNDHYYKGSWILHTFRTLVGDEAFFDLLREFYQDHTIGIVSTSDWLRCVSDKFGPKYETFWRQYLFQAALPTLRVVPSANGHTVAYFADALPGFSLSLKLGNQTFLVTDRPQDLAISPKEWNAFHANAYLLEYDFRAMKP